MRPAVLGGVGVVTLLLGLILGWFAFPKIVKQQVLKNVVLESGSEAFSRWQVIPQALIFKVYLFNVTNPDEVDQGANPTVQEVGPYHYDQYRERVNIKLHPEDDTISYNEKQTYVFNQEKSGTLSEDDEVTILNVAVVGMANKVATMLRGMLATVNVYINDMAAVDTPTAFLTGKVKDLLFDGHTAINCTSSLCKSISGLVRSQLPEMVRESDEEGIFKFSFFHHKNGTGKTRFRIKRGVKDPSELGKIVTVDDQPSAMVWNDPVCNAINGTDSTIFPPFVDPSRYQIYIYTPDICRSMYAVYRNRNITRGVPVIQYSVDDQVMEFSNLTGYDCFCYKQCLPDGALDLSKCLGVPVVMTFPHFFMGSYEMRNYVGGIENSRSKHQTFVDLEPNTGVAVSGAKRMQLNMMLTRYEKLDLLRNVSEGLFPITWIEEGFEMDSANLQLLLNFYSMLKILLIVKWALVCVGLAVVLLAICLQMHREEMWCFSDLGDNRVTTASVLTTSDKTAAVPGFSINYGYVNDGGGVIQRKDLTPIESFARFSTERGSVTRGVERHRRNTDDKDITLASIFN